MPRNGSGVYSLPSGNPVVDDTTIEASWANTTLSDLAAEITGSLPRNGAAPMTGTLGMGSNKIVNLANGTAATDAATKGQVDTGDAAAVTALSGHVAAADPHPGYLTEAAAAAAYQPLDGELTALAGLTSAADKVPRFTGSGTAEVITIDSGTYTPTFSNFSGVSGVVNAIAMYTIIGNICRVDAEVTVTTTTTTGNSFSMSLPVAAGGDLTGQAIGARINGGLIGHIAGPLSGAAYVLMNGDTATGADVVAISFSYVI